MVKMLALIPQREDISREEFHSHWVSPHGEMACGIDTMQAYVQSHRIRPGVPGLAEAEFEGIAEVWFDDMETGLAMGEHPVYVEQVQPDESNFIDGEHLAFVFADEHVLRAGPAVAKDDAPGVKAQLLLRRSPGSSPEDFDGAWAGADAEAESAFPAATRIVRTESRAESYAEGEPPADGFLEVWWPDRESFEADWETGGPRYLESLRAFVNLEASSAFLAQELRLIWP